MKGVTDIEVKIAKNGFLVEYSGTTDDGDWVSVREICVSPTSLVNLIEDIRDHMQ